MDLPNRVPIMVLPGALLFPHALLPLHIFEPRYREMLAHVLASDRVFAVAMIRPGVPEARTVDDFFHVAGVGLVRACVGSPDGTSNLILQGLCRVRFTRFLQDKPFRIAAIEPLLAEEEENTVEIEALGTKVIELCQRFKERGVDLPPPLATHLSQLTNPDLLADLVAAQPFFIADPFARQELLETPALAPRLRLLIQQLSAELG